MNSKLNSSTHFFLTTPLNISDKPLQLKRNIENNIRVFSKENEETFIMTTSEADQLHILFFPLMAHGHLLPTVDTVKLFVARRIRSTVLTTPLNAPLFTNAIQNSQCFNVKIIRFPTKEAGLPDGFENLDLVTSQETHKRFFSALSMLQEPLEQAIEELRPHGLIADLFFPWASDVASKYGIPRLVFHGTSFFSMCCYWNITFHQPHKKVSSESEMFSLPGFSDEVKFTRLQLPDNIRLENTNDFNRFINSAYEAEESSFGMLVNSFYELEAGYVDYYRRVLRKKAWHIGPLSLCNRSFDEKVTRGKGEITDEHQCLKWLDSKKPESVVYVCFGTSTKFSDSQLMEIANGLDASGQDFIWVVRAKKGKKNDEESEEKWLPEGYEKRINGKGLILRGWAPQVLILDHASVGGFVTHCGWNSALEGICAGIPMVTWPIFADQFFNEKLITDVLKIGVGVGAQKWVRLEGDYVECEAVERAVKQIMVGERAEEIRKRAKQLGEMARKAVEEGGSSYNDLSALIQELRSYHT